MTWIAWDSANADDNIAALTFADNGAVCEPCPLGDMRKRSVEHVRDVLAAVNSTDSFTEILNVVVAQAVQLFKPLAVVIGTWDPVTRRLGVQAAHGLQSGIAAQNLIESLLPTIGTRVPAMYARADGNGSAGSVAVDPANMVQALLFVPLYNDHTLAGAMLLYFAERRQLSAAEQQLVEMLGSQVAHAVAAVERQAKVKEATLMRERNRIARELHDAVTHALFTISLIAETLPQTWQSHPTNALQAIAKLHPLAQGALAEMRALLLELRADEGVDRNLGDLLRQLAERTHAFYDLPVTTTVVGDCPLPKHVQAALYRIAQEALNNTYKHAQASRATIQLHCQPTGAVVLRICDDGQGMERQQAGAFHLGLRIMHERAQEIGATLTVASAPGAGTRIVAEWQMA